MSSLTSGRPTLAHVTRAVGEDFFLTPRTAMIAAPLLTHWNPSHGFASGNRRPVRPQTGL